MEHKIGETFSYHGVMLEVVDNTARQFKCRDCYFYSPVYDTEICMDVYSCSPLHRTAGNRVIYKEKK